LKTEVSDPFSTEGTPLAIFANLFDTLEGLALEVETTPIATA
jgi:hypothetical protein